MKLGEGLEVEVQALLEHRLLVEAGPGAGKSFLLRRLCEQLSGVVPLVVIDVEGTFWTLRERHDFVLVGPTGDLPADPATAFDLAQRLLALRASAILDVSDLGGAARRRLVRRFVEGLIGPAIERRPLLVVLDEAQQFAPEGGASECAEALADLALRGRKRGLGLVVATQRLSGIRKDLAAGCGATLVGRVTLDVDVKRSGPRVGLRGRAAATTLASLRTGEFVGAGPCFGASPCRGIVGPVLTSHGDDGGVEPPAARRGSEEVLSHLGGLRRDEESVLLEPEGGRPDAIRIAEARASAAEARASAAEHALETQRELLVARLDVAMASLYTLRLSLDEATASAPASLDEATARTPASSTSTPTSAPPASSTSAHASAPPASSTSRATPASSTSRTTPASSTSRKVAPASSTSRTASSTSRMAPASSTSAHASAPPASSTSRKVAPASSTSTSREAPPEWTSATRREVTILWAIEQLSEAGFPQPPRSLVARAASVSGASSSFRTDLAHLRELNLLEPAGPGRVSLTRRGHEHVSRWAREWSLSRSPVERLLALTDSDLRIVSALRGRGPSPRVDVAQRAGHSPRSSTWRSSLGRLRSLGVITYPSQDSVELTTWARERLREGQV